MFFVINLLANLKEHLSCLGVKKLIKFTYKISIRYITRTIAILFTKYKNFSTQDCSMRKSCPKINKNFMNFKTIFQIRHFLGQTIAHTHTMHTHKHTRTHTHTHTHKHTHTYIYILYIYIYIYIYICVSIYIYIYIYIHIYIYIYIYIYQCM